MPFSYYGQFEILSAGDIVQRTLSQKNIMCIVNLRLKEVQDRLSDHKITVQMDGEVKNYLATCSYLPVYGARPLNRAIQTELLNLLLVMLLSGRMQDGEVICIGFDGP